MNKQNLPNQAQQKVMNQPNPNVSPMGNFLATQANNQCPPVIQQQSGIQLANSTAQAAAMGTAPDIVKSIPAVNRKDWHIQVNQDLRNHLVHKL